MVESLAGLHPARHPATTGAASDDLKTPEETQGCESNCPRCGLEDAIPGVQQLVCQLSTFMAPLIAQRLVRQLHNFMAAPLAVRHRCRRGEHWSSEPSAEG